MAETKNTFQQKMRVIAKLRDSGCRSEKALNELPMETVLTIPGINLQDIGIILELKKQVKSNHLFSYLTQMEKLMKETKSDEKDTDGTQTGEWDEEAE